MANEITILDLQNARSDAYHIAEVATGISQTTARPIAYSTDRLGNEKPTIPTVLTGMARFNFRGDWEAGMTLSFKDVVTHDGITYLSVNPEPYVSTDINADLASGSVVIYQGLTSFDIGMPGGASLIGFIQGGAGAVARTAQEKMRERISVDDYFQIGDADFTNAFERAGTYLAQRGGGTIVCPQPSYIASHIDIRRYQLIESFSGATVELKQAAGSNRDFITSENFAVLTGSGLDVAGDSRVPSWFGLRRVLVNCSGNVAGRGVAFYGSNVIVDDVVVLRAAGDGLHTEYATNVTGTAGVSTQEEGYVRNVICRDNGGVGWRNRGPHNLFVDNAICCFNNDWGYVSEILAGKYNGAPTYVTSLHCYSNDMNWETASNRARRNMYIGTNMSCGLLAVDGSQCEIRGSNSMISIVKQYLGGQGGDSLILSGSQISIGSHYGIMRNDDVSSGFTVLRITGNFNQIGTSNISGTLNRFDGVDITGVSNSIGDLVAQNCRTALTVSGSRNRIGGYLGNNLVGFNYKTPTDVHGGYNQIGLRIYQTTGAYVSGDQPTNGKDKFDIMANGLSAVPAKTSNVFEIAALPLDSTAIQEVSVEHGLMYTPVHRYVQLTMTGLVGGSTVQMAWGPRCTAVDATHITIQYKCSTAGPAGSQMSVSGSVVLS
ncbi:hypothetical protein HDG34_005882 [Paraburkholderia sp. HC6.4b]|uniref:hypothetical protein n=1 Tax=unclassified Paraburkholderia TaxID=2615204 RepID=UPI00160B2850|nr:MULTISPECIES: hypothetical protein [unclassified Paraburkholderia]MBB5411916.1 hypothetical protein [Paraburkholderia sp. HC6.4b]MBB5450228.1 hypothetical protein [Paraburkholderia sp. Kb1A]